MFNLGTAVGYLALNAQQVGRGVNQAIGHIRRLPGAISQASGQMQDVYQQNFFALRDMSTAFAGVAIAAATGFGLAAKAAIEWESSMAGVERTTYNTAASAETNARSLGVLEEQLLSLASRKPIATTDLAGIAEEAGALGLRSEDIAGFSGVIADMEAATGVAGDVATSALARIGNIMGATTSDYERMGSATAELGRSTASTEGEILTMARRIAGAGKTVGISTDEVLSFAAAMASVGIREEQGGSGISRTFIDIQNAVTEGGRELELFAAISGKTVEGFKTDFGEDAAGTTAAFVNGLGDMQRSGMDVFAVLNELGIVEVRQRDVLLRLASAGDLLNKTLATGSKAYEENTALSEIAERRYATTAAQVAVLKNQFFEVGVQIGTLLLPAIKLLVGLVSSLAAGLQGLPGPLRIGVALLLALGGASAGLVTVVAFLVPRIHSANIALQAMAASSVRAGVAINFLQRSVKVIGALLTVAAVALTVFGAKQKDAADDASALAKAQEEVASAVTSMRRGNDNAVKGWALQKAQVTGLAGELEGAGVSMETFLAAVTQGSNSAAANNIWGTLAEQMRRYRAELEAGGASPDESLQAATAKYQPLIQKVEDYISAVSTEKNKQDALNESLKQHGIVSQEMEADLQKLSAAREEEIEKIDKMNQAQMDLIDAQRGARAAQLGLIDAQQRYKEAQRDVARIGETIRAQQDKITAARLDERSALRDLADAQRELSSARAKAAKAVRDAEMDLADAHEGRITAEERIRDLQEELSEASGTSAESINNVKNAVNSLNKAMLSLRHAQVDVVDAQWQLNYLMQEGASARDIADAQLALADANQAVADTEQSINDARQNYSDLTDPVKKAKERAKIERELVSAQRDAVRATDSVREAHEALSQARADLSSDRAYIEALADVESSEIAVRDARLRTREELDALHALQNGEVERAFAQAQLDLEDAYFRVATANVEVMKQMALARGETWTVEQQVAALKGELIRLGQEAGPISASVAANLDNMGRSLIANTPPRHINITADGTQAVSEAQQVGEQMRQQAEKSKTWWSQAGNWIVNNVFRPMKTWISSLLQDMNPFSAQNRRGGNIGGGPDTPWVPWAKGGLVTRAHLGLVGEAGPELILPMRDMRRVWQLLEESGLMGMISSRLMREMSGGASALDQFRLQQSVGAIGERIGRRETELVGASTTNNDTTNMKFISQADPQRIAGAVAWKRRVRRR